MKRLGVLLTLTCIALAAPARANEGASSEALEPAALFRDAHEALVDGRPGEAIAKLEALADRGVVDAVISFDRGLAYAARVRAGNEQPGDLGRAAHGFEETRSLTRDPSLRSDATTALSIIRSEVARRRARAGDPAEIDQGLSLGRWLIDLLPENTSAILAAVMALVLSGAILARGRLSSSRAKVAATTTASISGVLLVALSGLAWAARDVRLHTREGVVIAPSARLLDASHVILAGVQPVPEGARARILDESGGFSEVVVAGVKGYLPSSAVLPIAKHGASVERGALHTAAHSR